MISGSDKISEFPEEFNALEKRIKVSEEELELLKNRVASLEK